MRSACLCWSNWRDLVRCFILGHNRYSASCIIPQKEDIDICKVRSHLTDPQTISIDDGNRQVCTKQIGILNYTIFVTFQCEQCLNYDSTLWSMLFHSKKRDLYSEFCQKIKCFKFLKTISKDKATTALELGQAIFTEYTANLETTPKLKIS